MESMGDRLKWCRQRFGWTQRDLARAAGVGLATVRRVEQAQFAPRLATVQRLAATLRVRDGWLAFGDGPMVARGNTTADEQRRAQIGPGAEGPPGYAVGEGGPWYRDEAGEWQIDVRLVRETGMEA